MPKISIITPLYNGGKTFRETAESVINQDFTDWEWILFDDGSTDDTKEIAGELIKSHPGKIFYFSHEGNKNYGTSFTRNRAAEKSNGDIISFIDQDDVWFKNRLRHQIEILEKHENCAMIWGPSLYWYEDREFCQPVGSKGKGLESGLYEAPYFIKIFLGNFWGTPLPSATFVRRKHFIEVNGYEESIRGAEDIVLWLKIAEKYAIYFDKEILVKYRKHTNSTLRVANQSGIMNEWNLNFYLWVIKFLKRTSNEKDLLDDMEFKFYNCLKKVTEDKNYFVSRKKLFEKLCEYPEIKSKYMKDFLLDAVLPYKLSTRISAKIRFDLFK